jgi:hypothetical protein
MPNHIYPTERQVVRALANAIATHRDVVNSKVYFPFIEGDRNIVKRIPLSSVRTFAGTEYIEDGLTLAVYLPGNDMGVGRAITYSDSHLGRPCDNYNYLKEADLKVVVQLYYQEPSYNAPAVIESERSSYLNEITKIIPYGRYIQYKESAPNDSLPAISLQEQYREPERHFMQEQKLVVNILPGEEILRDWMSIIRGVIRDIPELRPFAVRDPSILSVNYETPNWEGNDKLNLVFHTAYMVVTYKMFEPPRVSDFDFPQPEFKLSIQNAPPVEKPTTIPLLNPPVSPADLSQDDIQESDLIM